MPLRKEIKLLRRKAERLRTEIRIYREAKGLRGILAISANVICGYPKQVTLTAPGINHPLFVRLRASDAEVYEDVILEKEYDYPTPFSPWTIVDVGANCGMTSVFYANRYPDATVVTVEPETSDYTALIRNTRAYPNVVPVHAALCNEDGQVELFPVAENEKMGKVGVPHSPGRWLPALTLSTLMREVGIEAVDILKIDVEGADREIFSNCQWMDSVKLLAIELRDRASLDAATRSTQPRSSTRRPNAAS